MRDRDQGFRDVKEADPCAATYPLYAIKRGDGIGDIGDVYYGALSSQSIFAHRSHMHASIHSAHHAVGRGGGETEIEHAWLYSGASAVLGGMFQPGALEKMEASLLQLLPCPINADPTRAGHTRVFVDPAVRQVDQELDSKLPYLLVSLAASGYVRTPAPLDAAGARGREASMGLQEWSQCGDLTWPFVITPHFCGSERTGYFATPHSLRLSGQTLSSFSSCSSFASSFCPRPSFFSDELLRVVQGK